MVAVAKTVSYTPEEYLAREREAAFKSEYLEGTIYAMAGGSPEHSEISANTTIAIGLRLRGSQCRVFNSDMKVNTSPSGLFAYPDLTIVCGNPTLHDTRRDVLTNPVVLVEVLSPSTEAYDRGRKFTFCQKIESLKEYVLVSQEEARVEVFTRQSADKWLLTSASGLESTIEIASLNCLVPLAEIYNNIEFPPESTLEPDNEARRERP